MIPNSLLAQPLHFFYFCFLSSVPPQSHLFFSGSHHVLLASSHPILKSVILTVILWITLHQLRDALHQLYQMDKSDT